MSLKLLRALNIIFISFLVVACATNIAGRNQMVLVSESEAIEASREAYLTTLKPYEEEGRVNADAEAVARVNRITEDLIREAIKKRPDTRDWQWQVKVIEDADTVNAWCMAGGKMAIYSGLIDRLNATDDEIAQVMGHEISHAIANHSVERISVAMASELVVGVYNRITGATPTPDSLAAMAAQVALTLPNSRTSETEADAIGIELAAKAGYDPRAAVSLWQKMARVSTGRTPELLSTHPSPESRERALRALIPQVMPYYDAAKAS